MENLDDFFDRMVCHRGFLPLDNYFLQILSEVIDPKEVKVSNTIEAQNWNTKRNKDKNFIEFLRFRGQGWQSLEFVYDANDPGKWDEDD